MVGWLLAFAGTKSERQTNRQNYQQRHVRNRSVVHKVEYMSSEDTKRK